MNTLHVKPLRSSQKSYCVFKISNDMASCSCACSCYKCETRRYLKFLADVLLTSIVVSLCICVPMFCWSAITRPTFLMCMSTLLWGWLFGGCVCVCGVHSFCPMYVFKRAPVCGKNRFGLKRDIKMLPN